MHKTACKPTRIVSEMSHLTDNPGEQMQGHQNYISKVAMETLMTAGNSLTDVCLVANMSRIVVVSLLT